MDEDNDGLNDRRWEGGVRLECVFGNGVIRE